MITRHNAKFSSLSDDEMLQTARDIVAAKIGSFETLFRKRWKEGTAKIIKQLEKSVKSLEKAKSTDEVMGVEGSASRFIHDEVQDLILNEDFRFERRARFENDIMNTTLNFAYAKLFQRVALTLNALGLNPYLGFLHSANGRYESLACDIEEPFRAIVFNAVLSAINLQQLKSSDFVTSDRGIIIKQSGIKAILASFERELGRIDAKTGKTLAEELYDQCALIKSWAEGKSELTWYRWSDA